MDSSSRVAELKQPLLDLEDVALETYSSDRVAHKHELDVEYHVSTMAVEEEEEENSLRGNSVCIEGFITWVLLPTLLFSQFGMAFLMNDERTSCMSWSVVNLSIVLFVVTVWLYRHACNDANIKTICILLMPEILMDVVLGLVLFNRVALGFMALLVGMLCLSAFVVVSTAAFLYFGNREQEKEEVKTGPVGKLAPCQIV